MATNWLTKSARRLAAVLLGGVALSAVAAGAAAVVHASEIQRAYLEHTRKCVGLFLRDQVAHAAQCTPNTIDYVPFENDSDSDEIVAAPLPVVAPPVIVAPPPVVPEEIDLEPIGCGGSV